MSEKRNPVEIVAAAFGGQSKLARRLDVLPSTVSNWKRLGIPKAARWDISRELRAMRDERQIDDGQFMAAIEALETESDPDPEEAAAMIAA